MLNKLKKTTKRKSKTIGRGYGSGKGGHTVGRGSKGQKSRSGYKSPRPGFEGGKMPLSRRLPKLKGFKRDYFNKKKKVYKINIFQLNIFKNDDVVDIKKLVEAGFIKSKAKPVLVKILGTGKLEKKLKISNISVSKTARIKIEKVGGKIIEN